MKGTSKGCGSSGDAVIGMKGTVKGWDSCVDEVTSCGQIDKGY